MNDRTRPEFVVGVLTSIAILAAFASPLLYGEVYTNDDLLNYHLPLRALYASQLAEWHVPIWIPHLFCGFDLHGEGQVGLLHPLHLLLYATLPLRVAFMLEVVLPFPVMQLGFFVLLGRRGLGRDAAWFGSMIFAFAPALMLRFVHLNATAVLAHMPWLLVAIDGYLRSSGRARTIAGLAVASLTASQLLLGYPAFVWYSLVAECLYALWLAVPTSGWAGLSGLALAKLLGLIAGAVQLVPTIERLAQSVRREPLAFAGDLTSRRELIILSQWFDPYLVWYRVPIPAILKYQAFYYVHEASIYCGAAVPVLAIWTALRWSGGRIDRRLARGAVALGMLALVFAFIRLTPLWSIYRRIPILNLFRFNLRYYVLFMLGAAVVAAVGLADLASSARNGERRQWRSLWPLAVPPIVSSGLALGSIIASSWLPELDASLSKWPLSAAGPALSWAAALLVVAAARGRAWAPSALILLTAADLGFCNLSHIHAPISSHPSRPARATIPALCASLPEEPRGRGDRVMDEGATNRLLLKGLRLAGGYVGLTPTKALDYAHDAAARRIASVRAILLKEREGQPLRWELASNPLPKVRFVARAKVSRDPGRDLTQIDPEVEALVQSELNLSPGDPGRAVIAQDDGTLIRIDADAPSKQLLIVAESFDRGWEVSVDGHPAKVESVYGDFLGCVVPPGRHRVDFRYRPWSLRFGAIISLSGLAALGIWLIYGPIVSFLRLAYGAREIRSLSAGSDSSGFNK